MRITIIQGAFLPVPAVLGGAVEKMWQALGAEFARRGHSVTHVSRRCGGLPAREIRDGVEHVRVRGYDQPRGRLRLKALDLLYSWRACRRAPPSDVVVTNTFWSPILAGRGRGAVYVDVQRMPQGQMRLYRRAARLRANSQAVRAAILREAPEAADRVKVIPNPLSSAPGRAVGWERKTPTWLFAGRIHPEKGIELLLRAFGRIRAGGGGDGWRLELIGPADTARGGGGREWAAGLAARFAHPDVLWRDPIYDPAELDRAYERAGAFVYPSLADKGETFGVAVLEAMAWGAVPVVSDLDCFRDFVLPGRNGIVFNHRAGDPVGALAEAMGRAASPSARRMGEEAVGVRESHSIGKIAGQFLEDFAEVAR